MFKINKPSSGEPKKENIDEDRRRVMKGIGALLGLGAAGLLGDDSSGEEKYKDKSCNDTECFIGDPEGGGGKGSPEGSAAQGRTCSPEEDLWSKNGKCYCTPQATCNDSGNSCEAPCFRYKDQCQPPHKWECF